MTIIMRLQTIILLMLLFFALSSYAQTDSTQVKAEKQEQAEKEKSETDKKKKKEKTIALTGYASDSFTKARVPKDSLKVYLLNVTDSAVVDTAEVWESWNYTGISSTGYGFAVPARPAKYIIKATHPDYETTYMNYEVRYIRRNRYFALPALRMRRLRRDFDRDGGNLDEVVVTATKVKMVYKGDTIVYNADAFNIPEGSMLDALIKQLPGVELKENGEIFVNGKKIDNLTLNGADFFKGKNKMMLENLPYYTVKNVEVFNKSTPRSKFTGRDVEQKEYTMDVVLKREYHVGGTAYVEGGYGTDNRYRGKGFGMRYSDHSRAILFGGANNLNEYIDFDREGNDRSRTEASGDRDVRQVGGAWSLHAPEDRATNTLEYDLKWEDNHGESRQQSENYLAGASTFGKTNNVNNSRPFSVDARNVFMLQKPFFLYSWVDASYSHGHNESENESLTARDVLFSDSINLNWNRNRSKSDRMNIAFQNQASIKLPWGDVLELQANIQSQRTWNAHSFSQNRYTFYTTGVVDQRNQYNDSPSSGFSASGRVGYGLHLTEHFLIQPYVGISYDFSDNDNNRYRLDWLGPDWSVGGPHPMGALPPSDVLVNALDHPNSSKQETRLNTPSVGLEMSYNKPFKNNGQMYFALQLTEKYPRNHMRYDNDMVHAAINKNYRSPQAFFNFYIAFDNYHKSIDGFIQNNMQLPNISQMVDITSTANPLNIVKGNPDLKPMNLWYGNVSFSSRKDSINLVDRMENELGWKVYDTLADIDVTCKKYAVMANAVHMPHAAERGDFLPRAVKTALKTLDNAENGFFLMVEGSQIDFACHGNDSTWMMDEMLDFDYAIKVALDYAKEKGNTLVVVTADHETGGLTLPDPQGKYTNVVFDYSTRSHTCLPVMVYAYGPGAEQFTGWMQNTTIKGKILNACGLENISDTLKEYDGLKIKAVKVNLDSKPEK